MGIDAITQTTAVIKKQKPPTLPERLNDAGLDRELCRQCSLCTTCVTPFLRPFVPKGWTGDYLGVAEGPGKHEDEVSFRPLTGPAGQLLRRLLRAAGIGDTQIAFVNAVRCRPPNNREPRMGEVRACRPFLLQTINVLRPKYVVAFGGTALRALRDKGNVGSVTSNRGRLLDIPGVTEQPSATWCTYHPSAVLRGATALGREIICDLRRTWEPTEPPDYAVPSSGRGVGSVGVHAVDTEYTPTYQLLTLAVANATQAFALEPDEGDLAALVPTSGVLVGHSCTGDVGQLLDLGVSVPEGWVTGTDVWDSLLLARLRNENLQSYELENLLLSRRYVKPWKEPSATMFANLGNMAYVPASVRKERCRLDAWASFLLATEDVGRVPENLRTFAHQIAATVGRVCDAGLMLDTEYHAKYAEEVGYSLAKARDLLERLSLRNDMPGFRPTNDNDIRALLYDKLGLPANKKTETGLAAVDKVTLRNLEHPAADLLLDFSKWDKANSIGIEGIRELWHPLGGGGRLAYLPLHINPLGARTGRRSSNDPNCQNWPKKFRQVVVSRFPGGVIGDFDYSRLEVVLMAWVAQDEELLRIFTSGGGYIEVATDLWGKTVEKDTQEYTITKSVILGVDYNMQAWKMANELWYKLGVHLASDFKTHLDAVSRLRQAYLRRFPGIGRYIKARREELLATGEIINVLGQKRRLPCPDGEKTPGFWRLLNQAVNFPIQSLASYVTGSALIDVEREVLREHGIGYIEWARTLYRESKKYLTSSPGDVIITPALVVPTIINEVHDDVVVDIPEDNQKRSIELVVETMKAVPTLRKYVDLDVPLNLGVSVSTRWGG